MVGLRFTETMSGSYALIDKPDERRRFQFTVQAAARSWRKLLDSGVCELRGTLDAEGLADGAAARGTLTFGRGTISYSIEFRDNRGRPLRFAGTKFVELSRLVKTMTELPGHILDQEGGKIAECRATFSLRAELWPMLSSFRLA